MKNLHILIALLLCIALFSDCMSKEEIPDESGPLIITNDYTLSNEPESSYTPEQALVDFQSVNSDVIGVIRIEDTLLDYPLMYREGEEEYYLRKDINENYSTAGLPFMQQGCSLDEGNVFIYGHYYKNGEMFGCIHNYLYNVLYYIEHPIIDIYTESEHQQWKIFAVCEMNIWDEGFIYNRNKYIEFETEGEFNMYMSQVLKNNTIETEERAHFGDRILFLSTCKDYSENSTHRVVAFAKKIE